MEIKPGMKGLWSIAGGSELVAEKKDKSGGWWCKWHDGKEYRTDLFIMEELTTENPNAPEVANEDGDGEEEVTGKKKRRR